ncbi:lipid A biosynthesis (KDO)2-(lauroyl)-lipid IVA acyltransferase [Vibrio azureus]|uniref:Lipid A biosynthesis acyltransferase n=1 Tax=Vibrio azureus NBRC 104587 TaxID=1219077 RepID=U3C126_9VIBR|nr:lauroyl-Kdo(2)-lipid IV(A) myristoyltransferase [Vibrio azureus]AUI85111.1 lipid A biosynthesis (KDO)2-(lauroyl)-lipid IVA acyltransferase [Vibrio azureus]GAD75214.1 lipid A biosynthesis (KDO)2-(lauroyl)-lipid IVA acyltransferase [Vibrio azureus NBRC 104587]
MTEQRNDFDPKAYNPVFQRHFLAPKYWLTWLGVILAVPLSLLPFSLQKWLAKIIASKMVKSSKGPIHRIRVNFELCFPEKSFAEREALIEKTLYTAALFFFRFGLLSLRSSKWLQRRCQIRGLDILQKHIDNDEKVILMVPHSWAIDVPAVLLASMGMPVSAMAKKQKNEVADWLMHRQRVQYGGRVYERSGGIKPFLKSIRDGYIGYYLPDQDHGPEHSVFVDFFATRKATLPGLGKIAKLSRAKVLPMFASINSEDGSFDIEILPAFELDKGEEQDARTCNQAIEYFVASKPEQYMWILQLLRSQENGNNYYNLFKPRYDSDWKVQ